MITRFDFVPQAAQAIIQIITPLDGNALGVYVDGVLQAFEFDNNGAVSPPRILVPIGGSASACAANLAAAINLHWGDRIRATATGDFVDLIALHPAINLQVSTFSGASVSHLVLVPQRGLPTAMAMVRRAVYPPDVARGKIVVKVRLDYIEQVMVEFLAPSSGTAYTGGWHLDWTGYVNTAPGVIELVNAGGTPFTEAHWMQLLAIGNRYEQ